MTRLFRTLVFSTCACGCICVPAYAETTEPGGSPAAVAQADQAGNEVVFWDQMTVEQRVRLWPMLTHEQRLFQWRYMNKEERRQMRVHMTPTQRRAIKQRYVVDGAASHESAKRPVRKMTPAERELLRQQVIEVHIEIRRGIPYGCTDPTDCPRSAFGQHTAAKRMQAPIPVELLRADAHTKPVPSAMPRYENQRVP